VDTDKQLRVVIVDDHADIRELLGLRIEQLGHHVVGKAASGEQGVELCGELQPDLVLLDMSMPGLGGLAALPLIGEASPESQVVVLSGHDESHGRDAALAAGAAAYVEKSLRIDLGAIIESVTAGRS